MDRVEVKAAATARWGRRLKNIPGRLRGHWVVFVAGEGFCFVETGDKVPEQVPCTKCGLCSKWWDPDPCLGWRPGVVEACCGHGHHEGHLRYADSTYLCLRRIP